MIRTTLIVLSLLVFQTAKAQDLWTADRCIAYAVAHNHGVKQKELNLDDNRANRLQAVGSFLPSISGGTGIGFNFGRAIDPETNAYTTVSTFSNSYSLGASLPLFDGMNRINQLKIARANVLMGKYGVQAEKDNVAMRVFQAFIDASYYRETLRMVNQKREESRLLLRQTQVMEQVGQKSLADVAQMEATFAGDEYEVARQESLLENALLELKKLMNYPINDTLRLDTTICEVAVNASESALQIYEQARFMNLAVLQAELNTKVAKYGLRSAWSSVMPSISMSAGVSTGYNTVLGEPRTTGFSDQLRNKVGQYISFSMSIPIFNKFSTITSIRRSRNNLRRAQDDLESANTELQTLITQAVTDRNNAWREIDKMSRKVEADSLASQVTVRKYQEGQSSAIDVQTSASNLLQSRAQLLQCRLALVLKEKMVNYYKGSSLWTEQ